MNRIAAAWMDSPLTTNSPASPATWRAWPGLGRMLAVRANRAKLCQTMVKLALVVWLAVAAVAWGQPGGDAPRQFPVGSPGRLEELPEGRLRAELLRLPPAARERAAQWLRSFHFPEADVASLHSDARGGIHYVCRFPVPALAETPSLGEEPPPISRAAVPVHPFPDHLKFHSRPGAPNVLFLNFTGETVTNTQWNTTLGRAEIPALPFSTDADYSTFSDAEQTAIRRIWQRVAEDYAPFQIDVTTERPVTFNNRTAVALITRNTDANGAPNPYSDAGGVAYVNVFNTTTYAQYRPAWIYHNNLANNESYLAEAAAHEIGHNLGLSHDGLIGGTEYYGGHGGGEISWAPIMGASYDRNVTQWSKGEYYQANNTQDDLAILTGKIAYHTDDHGNSAGAATPLVLSGTNIVSTTPESDPANTNTVNKGVLERNTDVDVFTFLTGTGPVRVAVNPWVMPVGTRGGNLDVLLELYNSAGVLVATNNPPTQTGAVIQTNLTADRYFLRVRNTGAGNPFASTPTGYTAYGTVGQYFLSGYIAAAAGFVLPPMASLQITDLTSAGQALKRFAVSYTDDLGIAVATLDGADIRVTGPNGYEQLAQWLAVDLPGNGSPRIATYAIAPSSGGVWLPEHNGLYTVWMQSNQVADVAGEPVPGGPLGQFTVAVPPTVYAAGMDTDPGWSLDPQWQYGVPNYSGGNAPTSGFTGPQVIGYNLTGNYANNLSPRYATTPPFDTTGSAKLTLRFRRWLGLHQSDSAFIQVSTNGVNWIPLWASSGGVADTAWQEVQYPLPPEVVGPPAVRLRWGLSSSPSRNDLGWHLDDVEVLVVGLADTNAPSAALTVTDLAVGGMAQHTCSVRYTDDSAVRLATLGNGDLVVTGPNGYSNYVAFVGADLPEDGSPVTAFYAIPAPHTVWGHADNGVYTVTLVENEVEDIHGNAVARTILGRFTVAIPPPPGALEVWPAEGLTASGPQGGPFNPGGATYMVTNTGGAALDWGATASAEWITLSVTGGRLEAGGSSNITVSLSQAVHGLPAGVYTATVAFTNTTTGDGDTERSVVLTITELPRFTLTIAVHPPEWGSVQPAGGEFVTGTVLELLATPAMWYRFDHWTGDATGPSNPVSLVIETNLFIQAVFAEVLTTNFLTPHWWLAHHGYTNDFEAVVTNRGVNDMALWQSYIAGLDPNDPSSRLQLHAEFSPTLGADVLQWTTVAGRVYSLRMATNEPHQFAPLAGAVDLPDSVRSFTNRLGVDAAQRFYRLEVRKP